MNKEAQTIFPLEVSSRVVLSSLNAVQTIEMNGIQYVPDAYTSFVEFRLAHAFPVVTVDGLALHPQVVANSFRSLKYKVFNFGHIMRAYNPEENARDRTLGTIVDVEFPSAPLGTGWKVGASRAEAPGIRAVAAMHKQAEGVDRLIGQFKTGRKKWTVSRENDYFLEDSGFLVKQRAGGLQPPPSDRGLQTHGTLEGREWATPDDLARLGYVYIPCVDSPDELLACYDTKRGLIKKGWLGFPVVLLVGGLNGAVQFKGTGLTPLGKEDEARILSLAASSATGMEAEAFLNDVVDDGSTESRPSADEFLSPLKNLLDAQNNMLSV